VGFGTFWACLAALLVYLFAPAAAGSGIPEVKTILSHGMPWHAILGDTGITWSRSTKRSWMVDDGSGSGHIFLNSI